MRGPRLARSPTTTSSSRCPTTRSRPSFGQEWFIRHGVPEDHRDDDLLADLDLTRCPTGWTHTALAQQLVFGAGALRPAARAGQGRSAPARPCSSPPRAGSARPTGERGRSGSSAARWPPPSPRCSRTCRCPLVQQAVLQARRDGIDVVVSFGGGSCADLGKAVCFFLEQEAGMPGLEPPRPARRAARQHPHHLLGRRAHARSSA